jgi:DNA-binding Lrp family transcriptional regulator
MLNAYPELQIFILTWFRCPFLLPCTSHPEEKLNASVSLVVVALKQVPDLMAKAFVFINVELGAENVVLDHLHDVPEVKESHLVYSQYDIVAKVETDSIDHLKEVITWKIRKHDGVRSTLTAVVM